MTAWTVARQAPLSLGFSRQEYWNGLPFPSPRDLPNPGIGPKSPALAGRFFTTDTSGEPSFTVSYNKEAVHVDLGAHFTVVKKYISGFVPVFVLSSTDTDNTDMIQKQPLRAIKK